MLKITDFLTDHENLVNLLSVATYGNYWPSVATYKSDAEAGLFDDCECSGTLTGINDGYFYLSDRVSVNGGKAYDERYREVKPYLRPMETMTEEESKKLSEMGKTMFRKISDGWFKELANTMQIEWLDEHMFDYRGLIPMGLALELTDW